MSDDHSNASGPILHWFESDGLYLAVDRTSGHALDGLPMNSTTLAEVPDLVDAMVLADQEPLLQCLDAWLEQSFNWQPAHLAGTNAEDEASSADIPSSAGLALHEQTHYPQLTVSLAALEGQRRIVYLSIPHAELKQMPALPEQWQSLVTLTHHACLAHVVLQSSSLSADELIRLKPGGMVLLSDSFAESWPVLLRPDNPATTGSFSPLGATLRAEENILRLVEVETDDPFERQADESMLVLTLENPIMINQLYINSAMRSGQNVLIPLPDSLEGARVVVLQGGANEPSMAGCIMPVGRGFGVLLENMTASGCNHQD
ncbi:MAG: hypothetical protein KTR32_09655 [Granulosicoccus sp.]|nr:hypothetical protein [Granulosicoccus sp.]